jgi:adenylate cyclase
VRACQFTTASLENPAMLGALVPCGGGDSIPLAKTRLVVGRERPCDVLLRYQNVSARHCELELNEGYWFVRDLQSTNGIRVNNIPCERRCLMPRDVLSVATHRFTIEYTPQTDRPPPEPERPMHLLEASLFEKAGLPSQTQKPPGTTVSDGDGELHGLDEAAGGEISLGELVPCGGGETLPLLKPRLIVGRGGHCDLVLRFVTVSSQHCELEFLDDFWHVRDLGSRNGIRINGEPCDAGWLKPRSILSIATHRYEVMYATAAKEPPAEPKPSIGRSLLEKAGLSRRNQ